MNMDQRTYERQQRSIFIGNIPYDATEEQLKEIFSEAGPIVSLRLLYDRETGKPKGYGFCEYKDIGTAQSALRNLATAQYNGRSLRVGPASGDVKEEKVSISVPDNLYGNDIVPSEAPETISKAVASLPPEQMFELMRQMKQCIQNNPEDAQTMLMQNPQLAYALLQALIIMKVVDTQDAMNMLTLRSEVKPIPFSQEAMSSSDAIPPPILPPIQPPVVPLLTASASASSLLSTSGNLNLPKMEVVGAPAQVSFFPNNSTTPGDLAFPANPSGHLNPASHSRTLNHVDQMPIQTFNADHSELGSVSNRPDFSPSHGNVKVHSGPAEAPLRNTLSRGDPIGSDAPMDRRHLRSQMDHRSSGVPVEPLSPVSQHRSGLSGPSAQLLPPMQPPVIPQIPNQHGSLHSQSPRSSGKDIFDEDILGHPRSNSHRSPHREGSYSRGSGRPKGLLGDRPNEIPEPVIRPPERPPQNRDDGYRHGSRPKEEWIHRDEGWGRGSGFAPQSSEWPEETVRGHHPPLPRRISADFPSSQNNPVTEDEKAALILEVLRLTPEQIQMLPPAEKESIMMLREQIERNAGK